MWIMKGNLLHKQLLTAPRVRVAWALITTGACAHAKVTRPGAPLYVKLSANSCPTRKAGAQTE